MQKKILRISWPLLLVSSIGLTAEKNCIDPAYREAMERIGASKADQGKKVSGADQFEVIGKLIEAASLNNYAVDYAKVAEIKKAIIQKIESEMDHALFPFLFSQADTPQLRDTVEPVESWAERLWLDMSSHDVIHLQRMLSFFGSEVQMARLNVLAVNLEQKYGLEARIAGMQAVAELQQKFENHIKMFEHHFDLACEQRIQWNSTQGKPHLLDSSGAPTSKANASDDQSSGRKAE